MRFLTSWWSGRRQWARVAFVLGFLGVATAAVGWGRNSSLLHVTAASPPDQGQPLENRDQAQAAALLPSGNYSDRVVGYIYGSTPITREQLADYLIARFGAEKLELLANKLIIERECRQAGVEVTAAEIEAALQDDLKQINVNKEQFIKTVLKQRKVTLYEWKEDVIRIKLMLSKLCRNRVQVTAEDLEKRYQAHYGEKVQCQMIMWPGNQLNIAQKQYDDLRKSDEAFDSIARSQASGDLASMAGMLEPFGRNTTGNEALERAAFTLKPKEVSQIIGTPDGYAVIKVVKRMPPDTSHALETVRPQLEQEIIAMKVQTEIPKLFKEMRDRADPKLFLKDTTTERDLIRASQQTLGTNLAKPTTATLSPPQGH